MQSAENVITSVLRRLYSLIAGVFYSGEGFILFGYSYFVALNCREAFESVDPSYKQNFDAYTIFRLVLAVLQPVAHLQYLNAARYEPTMAVKYTTQLGNGSPAEGKSRYYLLMNIGCNIGLLLVSTWGLTTLVTGWQHDLFDLGYKIMEVISNGMLIVVLLARFVAWLIGKTGEWFYLAWPKGYGATAAVTAAKAPETPTPPSLVADDAKVAEAKGSAVVGQSIV